MSASWKFEISRVHYKLLTKPFKEEKDNANHRSFSMYNIGWTFDCFGLRLSCRQFERNLLLHCNMAHTVNELWCKNESTEHHFSQKLRLTFMMTGQDLFWTIEISMMTDRNFYDGMSRFYSKRSSFSWWQVEILLRTVMMTDRDFILNGQGFSWWQAGILFWTVEVFMMTDRDFLDDTSQDFIMNSRDFYDDKSRFSWWQVEILFWMVNIFMMTGWDFHDDRSRFYYERSRFSWWQFEIFMMIGRHFHNGRSRFS